MKRNILRRMASFMVLSLILAATNALAATSTVVATASEEIENAAPQRTETAWGRLVSDALRAAGKSDLALVNAGSLVKGSLKAGPITGKHIDALLSFPDDDVVVLALQGSTLRAAVELSLRAYPTGSPAYLQGSGWEGSFDPEAPVGKRLITLKINGKNVTPNATYQVVMPISLAQGANGYFIYWDASSAHSLHTSMSTAVTNYLHQKQVVKSTPARLKPQ